MKRPDITHALAEELARMPDYELRFNGAQLLQIACLLQLALRHPSLADEAESVTLFVRAFIASVRDGFGGYPLAQHVMDANGRGEAVPPLC